MAITITTTAINISLELIPTSHDKDEAAAASNSFEGDNRAAICRPIDDIGNGEGRKEERKKGYNNTVPERHRLGVAVVVVVVVVAEVVV